MDKKRVVAFVFLSLMLLSLIAGVVSAQTTWFEKLFGVGSSSTKSVFDPVKDMFSKWEAGDLSLNLAKYLFWFIVTLFVYSITKFIPGIKVLHGGAKFLLALVIGFLAIAYMTPSDVYTSLASYTALGFVLSALVPLIILLFFGIEIRREGGMGGRLIAKFMWFIFIVFLAWKLVDGMFGFTGGKVINLVEGWSYIGVIAFSLLWILVFEKQFLKMLFKEESGSILDENLHDVANVLVSEISQREERAKALSGAALKAYEVHTNNLRVRLKDVQKKLGK